MTETKEGISLEKAMDLLAYEDELYFSSKEKEALINTAPIAKKVQKLAPDVAIVPPLPQKKEAPSAAKKVYKEPILIICKDKKEPFWKNLRMALSNVFADALLVSVEELLDAELSSTKILIGWESLIQEKNIQTKLKELPQEKSYFFQDVPMILLEDHFYKKDPLKKKNIWENLCQKIPSLLR